jgi:hypothetical protein
VLATGTPVEAYTENVQRRRGLLFHPSLIVKNFDTRSCSEKRNRVEVADHESSA